MFYIWYVPVSGFARAVHHPMSGYCLAPYLDTIVDLLRTHFIHSWRIVPGSHWPPPHHCDHNCLVTCHDNSPRSPASALSDKDPPWPMVHVWGPWSVCGHHSPVVAGDLTRVIWGQSLSSELILGSKTVINCTWARGGAAVVRGGGGVFYDHSGLGSDHPWPWWHRDNGSYGDRDPWSSQCYDVSTPRSWEEHRAWEASNEREWEKKWWDGKKFRIWFRKYESNLLERRKFLVFIASVLRNRTAVSFFLDFWAPPQRLFWDKIQIQDLAQITYRSELLASQWYMYILRLE